MAAVGCLDASSPNKDGVDNDGAAVTCQSTPWQAGAFYPKGSIVTYNGSTYIAENDNPGYDPAVRTWYWARER